MSTELKDGQRLERVIRVHGIEGPVVLTVSPEGITFRAKGSKTAVTQNWVQVVNSTNTPSNVPSFLAGRPYEMLQHFAQRAHDKKTCPI